jgi:hypothetical protein
MILHAAMPAPDLASPIDAARKGYRCRILKILCRRQEIACGASLDSLPVQHREFAQALAPGS